MLVAPCTIASMPVRGIVPIAGALALGLALIHVLAGRMRFLAVQPRSRWLSAAGGVSVAYVFVHLLPELAESDVQFRQFGQRWAGFLEHHVYLIALAGMIVFYGLERLSKQSRRDNAQATGEDVTPPGVFWVHISAFAAYNALIGYLLLHREISGLRSLLLFAAAMATHFLVNDFGLRRDHKYRYDRYGRWLIAATVLGGWAIGWATHIHEAAIAALFGFLAGGVLLNVLKEELPQEQQSNFWAFLLGAAGYTALLLLVG
jgi:zinc transporter ZupT